MNITGADARHLSNLVQLYYDVSDRLRVYRRSAPGSMEYPDVRRAEIMLDHTAVLIGLLCPELATKLRLPGDTR